MTCENITTKPCSTCGEVKLLSEYSKHAGFKFGLQYECKQCVFEYNKAYRRSKAGLIAQILSHQKTVSIVRGHSKPAYNLKELRLWAFKCHKFNSLFALWIESGFQKKHTPSADRIDDYKPYTLDNLQWLPWHENKKKYHEDAKNGINTKLAKPVVQMNIDGTFVAEHYSVIRAERMTNGNRSHISECCKGKLKTSGGYRWMYSIGIPIHNNEVK